MNSAPTTYRLKSELAQFSLSSAGPDRNARLAWVNSICALFLVIGILGARRGVILINAVPPVRQIVPVVVIPQTLLPQPIAPQKQEQPRQQPAPVRVVVALPNAPDVNFSVPTIGALAGSPDLASAPPLQPLQAPAAVGSINSTGSGGDRPQPPYPPLAMQTGEQGTIVLVLSGDAAGNVVSITVRRSSGYPFLDQSTVTFLKTHWRLPSKTGTRTFQTTITYKLQS